MKTQRTETNHTISNT